MSAAVIAKMSSVDLAPLVYAENPSSWCSPLSFSINGTPVLGSAPPKPNCGIGVPAIIKLKKIAGTMKAKMSTQYWATCV